MEVASTLSCLVAHHHKLRIRQILRCSMAFREMPRSVTFIIYMIMKTRTRTYLRLGRAIKHHGPPRAAEVRRLKEEDEALVEAAFAGNAAGAKPAGAAAEAVATTELRRVAMAAFEEEEEEEEEELIPVLAGEVERLPAETIQIWVTLEEPI